ncbi:hypothetical protein [Burkholderia gladioli]|uniref:hypothetical protein n=1 Tax=Burkholderia gladioli TaxID=28095 RepID=UPI00163FBF79|nr:hypothetical protein [Burkholderia gladioli]
MNCRSVAAALVACVSMASGIAHADQFINFSQMGAPGTFAFETLPDVTHSGGQTSFSTNSIIAYFSNTGVTGTGRDQFEFWGGANAGYSKATDGGTGNSWGVSNPDVGIEYYYNVIQPSTCTTCSDFTQYTISPLFSVTLPSGSNDNTGIRAGSNHYSYYLGFTHYFKRGKWSISANPFAISYGAPTLNSVSFAPGQSSNPRGGFSYTVADIAAGYDILPGLGIGLHHALQLNNRSDSSFAPSTQGFIGPAISYFGFAKHGTYLAANLNFNYYHSSNLKNSPYFSAYIVQYF